MVLCCKQQSDLQEVAKAWGTSSYIYDKKQINSTSALSGGWNKTFLQPQTVADRYCKLGTSELSRLTGHNPPIVPETAPAVSSQHSVA